MAETPLELYKKAWELHYKQRKTDQACEAYETVLRAYPDSDAAGYAAVNLARIRAQDVSKSLSAPRRRAGPLALILVLICLAGTATGLWWQWTTIRQIQPLLVKQSLLSQALGMMYSGRDDDALQLLDKLEAAESQDITPFALSAEIYRRNNKFTEARKKYETYQRLYPNAPIPLAEIERINRDEDAFIRTAKQYEVKALPQDIVKKAEAEPVPAPARIPSRPPRQPRTRPAKPRLLVDPNEVKYF